MQSACPSQIRGYVLDRDRRRGSHRSPGVALATASEPRRRGDAVGMRSSILIAAHADRGPGLVAAGLSIATFDFFFVEPRFTLDVADPRFLITFAVMFAAGVAIGSLGSRLRTAEAAARDRAELMAREAAARRGRARGGAARGRPRGGPAARCCRRCRTTCDTPLAVVIHRHRDPERLRERPRPPASTRTSTVIVSEAQRLGRISREPARGHQGRRRAKPRREWVPIEELVGAAIARVEGCARRSPGRHRDRRRRARSRRSDPRRAVAREPDRQRERSTRRPARRSTWPRAAMARPSWVEGRRSRPRLARRRRAPGVRPVLHEGRQRRGGPRARGVPRHHHQRTAARSRRCAATAAGTTFRARFSRCGGDASTRRAARDARGRMTADLVLVVEDRGARCAGFCAPRCAGTAMRSPRRARSRRPSASPRIRHPRQCCSTSGCPTATASRCCAGCASGRARR